ncbi:hypothetical protein [Halobaculum sp. MBLA0143]|uniref:hypothetical protein n=1 Tax=Halobaculum sp. MBLA0143 TaxID=3079933 RepID=UPI003523FC4E
MGEPIETRPLDLAYGVAVSVAVYADLWQYGTPSYDPLTGGVYALSGVVAGVAVGAYRDTLSPRVELILLGSFTVTALPLLHATSSAELGLAVVTGTWTAVLSFDPRVLG